MEDTGKKTLVLGVGNIIMGDEGVGVAAVRLFEERYAVPEGVECLDGGTAGMALLDRIMDSARLIVVDAVSTGDPPGTVVRFTPDEVEEGSRFLSTTHQIGVPELLAIADFEGRAPKTVIIGIVPQSIAPGEGLTETAGKAAGEAAGRIAAELAGMGIELKERPTDA